MLPAMYMPDCTVTPWLTLYPDEGCLECHIFQATIVNSSTTPINFATTGILALLHHGTQQLLQQLLPLQQSASH